MQSWAIYLKNFLGEYVREGAVPQEGYVSANGLLFDRLAVCQDVSGARVFEQYESAEEMLRDLESRFGLDREEAEIREVFDGWSAFELKLGNGALEDVDGIRLTKQGESRFIEVWNMGEGASDEICGEVSELLMRILWKVQLRMASPK